MVIVAYFYHMCNNFLRNNTIESDSSENSTHDKCKIRQLISMVLDSFTSVRKFESMNYNACWQITRENEHHMKA